MEVDAPADILAEGLAFPEGPAFAPDGTLWGVELQGSALVHLVGGQLLRQPAGAASQPNGLAFDASGHLWVCDAGLNAIRRFDPDSRTWTTVVDSLNGAPLARPNDLAFDAAGNLVFSCPGHSRANPIGYVCCLRRGGGVHVIAQGFYFPNGVAFTPDGQHLVVAETRRQRLWRGRWDAERGLWLAPRPWASLGGNIGPDGLAFAADGTLFVAVLGAGEIKTVAPDGEVIAVIAVPGAKPTNCAFDPTGRLGLIVTEAERGQILSLPGLSKTAALFSP